MPARTYTRNILLFAPVVSPTDILLSFRDRYAYFINGSASFPVIARLPSDPFVDEAHTLKDASFAFGTNPLQVDGHGHAVESPTGGLSSTFTFHDPGTAVTYRFNGTNWALMSFYRS